MLDIRETGRARGRRRADRTDLHSRDGVGYATALPVRGTTDRKTQGPETGDLAWPIAHARTESAGAVGQSSKRGGRQSGLTTECRSEMAGTAEPSPDSNFLNAK